MRMTQIPDTKFRYSTATFDAIVDLARSIRPRWDVPGLRKAIRDALARDDQPTLAELAYAVLRVAENFSVESPAVIAMDGPHWRKAVPVNEPARAELCLRCRDYHMRHVDCVKEGWKPKPDRRSERTTRFTDQLRAELATVRADQCPHGPRCADCKKARDHADEETTHG
jgi:hypothetical protein